MKIAHLTSVHPRYDTRIFHKECKFLAAEGHTVYLVVADGKGDAEEGGVNVKNLSGIKNPSIFWQGGRT